MGSTGCGTGGVCSDGHPELLRGFDEYRVLLFGVLMVMMMIWRPRGWCAPAAAGCVAKGVAP